MTKPSMIPRLGDDPIHDEIRALRSKRHEIRQKKYRARSDKSISKYTEEEAKIDDEIMALEDKVRNAKGSYYESDWYGFNPHISGVWGLWGEQEYGGSKKPSRFYFGLADTMGVEGFFIAREDMVQQSLNHMMLRAKMSNPQRHPYAFIVRLTEPKAKHISALIENQLYVRAAKYARKQPTFKIIASSRAGGDEEILNALMDIYEKRQTAREIEIGVLNYVMFNLNEGD